MASCDLAVEIRHDNNELHWNRIFNNAQKMQSIFSPVGSIDNGYWIEETGALSLKLTVEIVNGGWHWKCLGYKFLGISLPLWLFPNSKAYKQIENGSYRFYVGFSAPLMGKLLSYEGVLELESKQP